MWPPWSPAKFDLGTEVTLPSWPPQLHISWPNTPSTSSIFFLWECWETPPLLTLTVNIPGRPAQVKPGWERSSWNSNGFHCASGNSLPRRCQFIILWNRHSMCGWRKCAPTGGCNTSPSVQLHFTSLIWCPIPTAAPHSCKEASALRTFRQEKRAFWHFIGQITGLLRLACATHCAKDICNGEHCNVQLLLCAL